MEKEDKIMLQLKEYVLPHEGIISGSKAGKREAVFAGTKVWCIAHGTLLFYYGYLRKKQAQYAMENLSKDLSKSVVAANFHDRVPHMVARPKD